MTARHGISSDTPKSIFIDAGAIYFNYGLSNEKRLGATRGGNEFNPGRVSKNIEVDGLKGAAKGMKRITEVNPQMTVNMIELSVYNLIKAIAGASSAETPVTKVIDAEYLGPGTTGLDNFTVAHYPVVAGSEKVYVAGDLKTRGTESDSHFVGGNKADNKGFDAAIGDWVQGSGGLLTSETNGVDGKAGKYVVGGTPSQTLPKLPGGSGTTLTNLVVGKKYKFVISAKYVSAWNGGVVTATIGGVAKALTEITTSYIQDVLTFVATTKDATINLTCASGPTTSDELWIDSLELVEYTGDYTINNTTGKVQFILDTVPTTDEAVTASYTYETEDPATQDTITGGEISDSDYIDNVALVGTISGKGTPVICIVENALADAGFSLSTSPRDEAVPSIVFTGHFDPADLTKEPWKIKYPRA